jgi:hypothetical protein
VKNLRRTRDVFGKARLRLRIEAFRRIVDRKPGMFPGEQISGELFVDKLLFQEKADELSPEVLSHLLQIAVRQVVEGSFAVESAFQDQCVPVGVPP